MHRYHSYNWFKFQVPSPNSLVSGTILKVSNLILSILYLAKQANKMPLLPFLQMSRRRRRRRRQKIRWPNLRLFRNSGLLLLLPPSGGRKSAPRVLIDRNTSSVRSRTERTKRACQGEPHKKGKTDGGLIWELKGAGQSPPLIRIKSKSKFWAGISYPLL